MQRREFSASNHCWIYSKRFRGAFHDDSNALMGLVKQAKVSGREVGRAEPTGIHGRYFVHQAILQLAFTARPLSELRRCCAGGLSAQPARVARAWDEIQFTSPVRHKKGRFQKLSILQTLLELRQRVTARSRQSGDGTPTKPKSPVWRQITRVVPFQSGVQNQSVGTAERGYK